MQKGNTFLSFPGTAPTELGASASEGASSKLAGVEPPRSSHGGGAKVQLTSAGRRLARRVTASLARFVTGGNGPEDRAMVCAARNGAHGFRVESWAEGRERREDGADDRCLPTNLGVCASDARQPDEAQSPTAQPRQEALRNLGLCRMRHKTQLCRLPDYAAWCASSSVRGALMRHNPSGRCAINSWNEHCIHSNQDHCRIARQPTAPVCRTLRNPAQAAGVRERNCQAPHPSLRSSS